MKTRDDLAKQLQERVRLVGECMEWSGSRGRRGYGFIRWCGRLAQTHRMAYEVFVGPIPVGLWVLHRCDNPPCVNPAHLFLGTARDNSADSISKGRWPRGSRIGTSTLSEADVSEIFRLRASGKSQKEIAAVFGVTVAPVCNILRRRTWRHVEVAEERYQRIIAVHGNTKITPEIRAQVVTLRGAGKKFREIGEALGIRLSLAYRAFRTSATEPEGEHTGDRPDFGGDGE